MPSTIPVEICELIIDIIKEEHQSRNISGRIQTSTLNACCLTCRDWLPKARKHLYTVVWLSANKINKFTRSISSNPSIGDLVRGLWLYHVDGNPQHELSLVPWQLPHRLSNLTRIGFHSVNFGHIHPRFFDLLRRFESVTTVICTFVQFSSLHQIPRLVMAFSNLKNFGCNYQTFPGREDGSSLATPLACRLRYKVPVKNLDLQLRSPEDVHVFELFLPTSVTTVQLWLEDSGEKMVPAVMSFLGSAEETLQRLEFHVRGGIRVSLLTREFPLSCS